eukprot:2739232-Rhodomonas_salina.1
MRGGHGRGLAEAKQEWLLQPQKLGREERRGVAEALPRRREEEAAESTRDGDGWREREGGGGEIRGEVGRDGEEGGVNEVRGAAKERVKLQHQSVLKAGRVRTASGSASIEERRGCVRRDVQVERVEAIEVTREESS